MKNNVRYTTPEEILRFYQVSGVSFSDLERLRAIQHQVTQNVRDQFSCVPGAVQLYSVVAVYLAGKVDGIREERAKRCGKAGANT